MITDSNVKDLMTILDNRMKDNVSSQLSDVLHMSPAAVTGLNEDGTVKVRLISEQEAKEGSFDVLNKSGESVAVGDYVWVGWFGDFTNAYVMMSNSKAANIARTVPVNLLDNSSFLVAQAGYGGLHGADMYVADRWIGVGIASASGLTCGGISVTDASGGTAAIYQNFNSGAGGSATFFANVTPADGKAVLTVYSLATGSPVQLATVVGSVGLILITASLPANTVCRVEIKPCIGSGGGTAQISYAGVFSGSYTQQTLPPYVQKSYEEELIVCQRYFVPPGTVNAWSTMVLTEANGNSRYGIIEIEVPVEMRITPSVVANEIPEVFHTGGWTPMTSANFSMTRYRNIYMLRQSASSDSILQALPSGTYLLRYVPGLSADM